MIQAIKKFFRIKEVQATLPEMPRYYNIREPELKWAAKQILFNKQKYIARVGNDDWIEFALLHYIVNRLNYGKLHYIVPRSLEAYTNHYYYQAAQEIKKRIMEEN